MDGATDCAAFDETVVFLKYSKTSKILASKARLPIRSMRSCCCVCLRCWPVQSGSPRSALFGTKKLALLRRIRPFKDGTPAHDHLGDILATLDAGQFRAASPPGLPR
jgi:hypothetical protein